MAYQKLQSSRFLKVIPSDTINIPNPAGEKISSTTTGTTASKLVDSAGDFVNKAIKVGDVIYNNTDSTIATVTAIDSATTLSVSADIFVSGESYTIYASQREGNVIPCVFHVTTGGTVTMVNQAGDVEQITSLDGQYHPVNIVRINATGTAATGIIAHW